MKTRICQVTDRYVGEWENNDNPFRVHSSTSTRLTNDHQNQFSTAETKRSSRSEAATSILISFYIVLRFQLRVKGLLTAYCRTDHDRGGGFLGVEAAPKPHRICGWEAKGEKKTTTAPIFRDKIKQWRKRESDKCSNEQNGKRTIQRGGLALLFLVANLN